jgi:hypothetical protein
LNSEETTGLSKGKLKAHLIIPKVKWWAVSGCSRKRRGLIIFLYTVENIEAGQGKIAFCKRMKQK